MLNSLQRERRIKVLLVDDNSELLEQAKIFIQREINSIILETVKSPKKALKKLKNNHYDCVVSDYQMPKMDGLEFLKKFKEEEDDEIPFIIFTGKGREEVAIKALNLGANRYLQKGGDPKSQYSILAEAIDQETNRKNIEKQLKKKEKKHRKVFNQTYDSMWIIDVRDDKFNYEQVNPQFYEFSGLEEGEVVGKKLEEIHPPETAKKIRKDYQKVLDKKEPIEKEQELQFSSGKKYHLTTLSPILDDNGEVNKIIGSGKDITERKKVEEEFERSKKKFKKFFDDLNAITFISKLNGDILEINNKAIDELGYSKEEIEDMNIIEDLSTLNYNEEDLNERNEKLKNGESISFEDELKRKDNTTFRVRAEVNPIILNGKVRSASINKKIEEKKRIKEKLETILVNSPNLVFEYDAEGNYQEIYTQSSDKLAGSKEEMLGNNVSEFLPQNAANVIKGAIKKSLKTKESQKTIFEIQSNGEKRCFSEHFTPIISKENNNRVISISREITKRKEMEEELEQSVNKFKKLFNDAPEPMVLMDENELILDVNSRFEDEFGYKLEELRGRNINDVVVPERLLEEAKMLDNKSKEGYTNFETKRKTKDREFHVSISATPINLKGKDYTIATYKNIEKRKKAEKELMESKEKYQSLIENLNEIVYVLNKDAEIEYITPNIEEISGYSPSEVTGKRFTKFVHPDDLEGRIKNFKKVLSGEGEPTEYRLITNDGEVRWVRTHARPVNEEGRIVGIQGVLSDITDRKKAEEREEFLHSLLRHDVRNKTQTIQGYLQLLEELELSNQARKYIKNAKKGIENELDLIEKVRILREVEEEEIQDINLKKSMEEALNIVKELKEDKEIKVDIECEEDSENVKAGPLLDQAFSNILENAIQHSKCQTIKITLQEKENKILCCIEDDGIGLSEDKKEKIFDKGYTTGKEKGTGLGLFLVKTLISIYGGEIGVKDSELGGARFDIYLQKA